MSTTTPRRQSSRSGTRASPKISMGRRSKPEQTVATTQQYAETPRASGWVDLAVVGLLAALIYALVTVAREWSGPLQLIPEIHLEARYLPLYTLFSLARGVIAYGVSFLFT